jgi:hypothetical protein
MSVKFKCPKGIVLPPGVLVGSSACISSESVTAFCRHCRIWPAVVCSTGWYSSPNQPQRSAKPARFIDQPAQPFDRS